ncbi:hypothetical protein EYF80_029576 [Liparis tanakae]|uniref:Uncharacterized protein n=1 Tax=Liparis tanakae TaxID=230148 RepID=A0A4Z2H3R2_9TELE|nr:hypothetical protein EYF80_029576 [Liparis tanakae]
MSSALPWCQLVAFVTCAGVLGAAAEVRDPSEFTLGRGPFPREGELFAVVSPGGLRDPDGALMSPTVPYPPNSPASCPRWSDVTGQLGMSRPHTPIPSAWALPPPHWRPTAPPGQSMEHVPNTDGDAHSGDRDLTYPAAPPPLLSSLSLCRIRPYLIVCLFSLAASSFRSQAGSDPVALRPCDLPSSTYGIHTISQGVCQLDAICNGSEACEELQKGPYNERAAFISSISGADSNSTCPLAVLCVDPERQDSSSNLGARADAAVSQDERSLRCTSPSTDHVSVPSSKERNETTQ